MKIKKNIPLILGVSIPILMILFVVASIYLPGIFIQPKYNFIYISGGYDLVYSVSGGKIIKATPLNPPYRPSLEEKLYFHDVLENKSKEISYEEAQKYNLDPNIESPDGFQVTYGTSSGGFFPFFFYSGTDYDTRYLTGHNVNKKLNILKSGLYSDSFRFLGWVK